jgi:RNA polymerase sigma factor (sigma-70 family)
MGINEALAVRAQQGDPQAREQLILRNQRLIHAVAYRYRRRHDYEDLVSAGQVGLISAIQRYNPKAGKFSTFAWWRILGALSHAAQAQTRYDSAHRSVAWSTLEGMIAAPEAEPDLDEQEAFASILKRVHPDYHQLLRWYYQEGCTLAGIAERLSVSKQRARQQMLSARKNLQRSCWRTHSRN